jgi:hypothetical protein
VYGTIIVTDLVVSIRPSTTKTRTRRSAAKIPPNEIKDFKAWETRSKGGGLRKEAAGNLIIIRHMRKAFIQKLFPNQSHGQSYPPSFVHANFFSPSSIRKTMVFPYFQNNPSAAGIEMLTYRFLPSGVFL